MDYINLLRNYNTYSDVFYKQRYLGFDLLENVLENLSQEYEILVEGKSELGQAIKSINLGNGKNNILIWSQMHGNETTTTKALIDMLRILSSNAYVHFKEKLFEHCSIKIIPILNPDGANSYTRSNANQIDLNRDAINKSQKETKVFFSIVEQFKPHYCFNMHGQRTIFSAGDQEYPATLSFLAPSFNDERSLNTIRKTSMQLVAATSDVLSSFIPNQISRYDDAFNENCFGDYLCKQGIPTVLFEAGHFQNDYCRDKTRQYVTLSLLAMLSSIISNGFENLNYKHYFNLPENKKRYVDVIINNIGSRKGKSLGILFKEECIDGKVVFNPIIEAIEDLETKFAHSYLNAEGKSVLINDSENFKVGESIKSLKFAGDRINDVFVKC